MTESATNLHYRVIAQTYEQIRPKLLAYLIRRTSDAALAEDILQDTFLQMLERVETIVEVTASQLAFCMATNMMIDKMRRRSKLYEIYSYLYDMIPKFGSTTDQQARVNDVLRIEWKVMEAMPPQRKKIYQLVHQEDMKLCDVAEIMSLDQRTVSSHLCFGRKEVRKALLQAGVV